MQIVNKFFKDEIRAPYVILPSGRNINEIDRFKRFLLPIDMTSANKNY